MATPAAAPTTVTDDDNRFSLLEIDEPVGESAQEPTPAPAPSPAPSKAVTADMTFQLAPDILRGVGSLSELGACMQSLAASLHALGVKQDDPRREPLRALARAVRCALVWVHLWGSLARAVTERPALVGALVPTAEPVATPAPVAAPVVAAPVAAPRVGTAERPYAATWSQLRGGGWGARITNVGGSPVANGERVRIVKRSGEQQDRVVTHVWWTDGSAALVSVGEIPAAPTTAPAATAPTTAKAPAQNERQAIPTIRETAPAGGTLAETLGNVAAESVANAGQASAGSMASGARAGVGFTSAEGYVTALRNGVKRATADGYLATLRTSYKYTDAQIAALTVTIIPEAPTGTRPALPHEIRTVRPDVNAMDLSTSERRKLWSMTPGQRAEAEQAKAANEAALTRLISLTAKKSGSIVSLGTARHGATATLAECEQAVTAIGRKDLAPRAKSAKAQFGDIMGRFSRGGLKAWAARRSQTDTWPADVVSRWIVGSLDGSGQLGSLGEKQIVAELLRDGQIRFTGGSAEQRERVQTEYTLRRNEQTLDATDLRDWIVATIEREWHAATWASNYFVPGSAEDHAPLHAFIKAIGALAGRSIEVAYLQDARGFAGGIARGQGDDVARLGRELDIAEEAARKQARANATKEGADPELAAARAVPSAEVAATLHKKCDELAVKIEGYALLVGDEIKPVKAALDALRARIPAADASALRAAMIELD